MTEAKKTLKRLQNLWTVHPEIKEFIDFLSGVRNGGLVEKVSRKIEESKRVSEAFELTRAINKELKKANPNEKFLLEKEFRLAEIYCNIEVMSTTKEKLEKPEIKKIFTKRPGRPRTVGSSQKYVKKCDLRC